MSNIASSSYGQIFKSTAFTGGASVIGIVLGIIRTKVMAVLLGPTGVGLISVYTSITGMASILAGMGIGSSGVRQIAESTGTGDQERIARTISTVQRTTLVMGAMGALLLVAFSLPVSLLTFGDDSHAIAIAALALAVFFSVVSGGQGAVIQGMRRIGDLARLNILGTLAGTLVGLPSIWLWRDRGIVPMLIVLAAAAWGFSWWFARRIPVLPVHVTWRESALEARSLLGLGLAFMASGLLSATVAYVIRLLIVRQLGLEAAGHYSAAFMLAGIYTGFIMQAMGTDFFPRLTAVADDHPTANRFVNEQSEIALLLAVPGLLGTLSLAPWVIRVFYAGSFDPAVEVLQWQVLGILGRVVSWPMGFILLAKGKGRLFLISEVLANAVHVGFVSILVSHYGVAGGGMAFAGMYLFHSVLMLFFSRDLTGFRWSKLNLQLLGWMLPLVAGVFIATTRLSHPWNLAAGLAATLLAGLVCCKGLLRRVPEHRLGRFTFLGAWARRTSNRDE